MDLNENQKKTPKVVDNSAFRDRFRFLLYVNDNIICERFFKINWFNKASLHSAELKRTVDSIVEMVQRDLVSKSRIRTWYTTLDEIKLTGFKPGGQGYRDRSDVLKYGEEQEPTKAEYVEEEPKPYSVTFKFSLEMAAKAVYDENNKPTYSDYKPVYEAIWDGSYYQKNIRSNVDLTNSDAQYRNRDLSMMRMKDEINMRMIVDKKDLLTTIIRMLCDTMSGESSEPMVDTDGYRDANGVEYSYDVFNKYIDSCRKCCDKKSRQYYKEFIPSDNEIEYIYRHY